MIITRQEKKIAFLRVMQSKNGTNRMRWAIGEALKHGGDRDDIRRDIEEFVRWSPPEVWKEAFKLIEEL